MSQQKVKDYRSSLQKSKNLNCSWGERWISPCCKERCPAGIISTVWKEILHQDETGPCHNPLMTVWQYFWQEKLCWHNSDRPSTDISSEVTQCTELFKGSVIHRLKPAICRYSRKPHLPAALRCWYLVPQKVTKVPLSTNFYQFCACEIYCVITHHISCREFLNLY